MTMEKPILEQKLSSKRAWRGNLNTPAKPAPPIVRSDKQTYFEQDGRIKRRDGDNVIDVGRHIIIKESWINRDSTEIYLVIEFDYTDGTHEVALPRGKLTKLGIMDLVAYGADITDDNYPHVLRWLRQCENAITPKVVHELLGWIQKDGKWTFFHQNGIGCDSEYAGILNLKPTGTYEAWRDMVYREVLGNYCLELALIMGFSSALIKHLQNYSAVNTLMFHAYGASSKGKTTALQLSVSVWGQPALGPGGLLRNWNGTNNAVLAVIENNHGIATAFDELSMLVTDFSNLLYKVESGSGKARCDEKGNLRKVSTWATTILSNGEMSFLQNTNRNVGIIVRLIELADCVFTISAKNANEIKTTVQQNYGHAGPLFVEYLIQLGHEGIVSRWRAEINGILSRMTTPDEFSDRIAGKLAIVILTGRLVNEALGLNLNVDRVLEVILENETHSVEARDQATLAYDFVLGFFSQHRSKFFPPVHDYGELWGQRESTGDGSLLIIVLTEILQDALIEAGFTNPAGILKSWKERGLLKTDTDRLSRKMPLQPGLGRVRTYSIIVPADQTETYGVFGGPARPRPKRYFSKATGQLVVQESLDVAADLQLTLEQPRTPSVSALENAEEHRQDLVHSESNAEYSDLSGLLVGTPSSADLDNSLLAKGLRPEDFQDHERKPRPRREASSGQFPQCRPREHRLSSGAPKAATQQPVESDGVTSSGMRRKHPLSRAKENVPIAFSKSAFVPSPETTETEDPEPEN